MDLNALLNQVKRLIYDDPSTPHQPNHDPSGLMGRLEGLFGNFGGNRQQSNEEMNVRPASEDPYGDPADQVGGYRQASHGSNYGQRSYPYVEGDVRPASEDPLGDPADYRPRD